MQETAFHLFDTAGNTTIFVAEPDAPKKALKAIPAEQAAWADITTDHVEMAGGEFCVNACLAYAAMKTVSGGTPHELHMAGESVELDIQGAFPGWFCSAVMQPARGQTFEKNGYAIAQLPGIVHILAPVADFADNADAARRGTELIAEMGFASSPAAGVVWWRKNEDFHEIKPLVTVPAANTCNIEGACGSGSVALALSLGYGEYKIKQPSGQYINIKYSASILEISAPVKLMASGALWLH